MTFDLFDRGPKGKAEPGAHPGGSTAYGQGEGPADDADEPLLRGLNPEQRAAVLHEEGPMLVLAGAGSGKTRVITHRIAHLVLNRRVPPWQILAVTFSNKAAGEMRHRLQTLLGPAAQDLWLGTFHSIGVRLLRQIGEFAGIPRSFTIYDRDDQQRMLTRVMRAAGISEKVHTPRKVAAYIDRAKNRCQLPGDPNLALGDSSERTAARGYGLYEDEMRRAGAVDFGDLLMRPVQIFQANEALRLHWAARLRHLLVDEFQDTNGAQYQLLELLSSVHHNLAVVGDDDQSIYSWRGAEIDNILGFPEAHPGALVVRLERNYRSTDVILATSGAVVRQNRRRHDKTLWTEQRDGAKVALHTAASDRDEADWVARCIEEQARAGVKLSEIAVFYRTNAQSRLLEESMSRFRLPYVVVGGLRFYERAEIKDFLAYCRLVVNPDDTASWLRAVNTPTRGIGDRTVELVEAHATAMALSLPRAAEDLLRRGEGGRARDKLAGFVKLIQGLRDSCATLPADTAGDRILRDSGLRDALLAEGSEEAEARLENLGAVVSAMAEFAAEAPDRSLQSYLETVALVADIDALKADGRHLSLMTMHAAKGLEFDVTFVTGLEAALVPHSNADVDEDEERRLLYVAMTRARKRMHLTLARVRTRFGREEMTQPSPFLRALPKEHLETTGVTGGFGAGSMSGGYGAGYGSGGYGGGFGGVARVAGHGGGPLGGRGGAGGLGLGDRSAVVARARASSGDAEAPGPAHGRGEPSDVPEIQRDIEGPFRAGSKVAHDAFGVGEVMEVSGYGAMARITVRFPRAGIKKVVARFLRPA